MTEIDNDRRHALRVQLRSHGNLTTVDGALGAHLLNLSVSGALIAVIEPHQLSVGEAIKLDIELPDGGSACMEGHIAHVNSHLFGLDCIPVADEDAAKIEKVIDRLAGDFQP
jgi:hypothetical protein